MVIRKLLIVIVIVFLFEGLAFAGLTVSEIVNKYSDSVVTIVGLDENDQPLSLGSGFFINTEGDIATNHHVLEGSAKVIIKTTGGEKGEVLEIIKDDPVLDLLIAKTTLKNTVPIPLGDSDIVTVGEDIIAIGNPAGLEGTVSKGIISGVRKAEGFKFIQITAPISPGSSGGPVFNLNGKAIGVATAYFDVGQNLNFAMPVNYLKSLKQNRIKLGSLPKMKAKDGAEERDYTLIEVFDVHHNVCQFENLCSIDFAIRNNSNYLIKNITLFFVYRNFKGEIVSYSTQRLPTGKKFESILPKMALQFQHSHHVKYWSQGYNQGSVEIRILDYEINRSGKTSPADLLLNK